MSPFVYSVMLRFLCLSFLLIGLSAMAVTDTSQARAVAAFLRNVAAGQDAHRLIDPLMAFPGTKLIIEQQNISRHVTADEYREVLLAIAEHREPRLVVSETDARAMKGKQGLVQDVFPSLRWGCEHVTVLETEIGAIEHGSGKPQVVVEWLIDRFGVPDSSQ